jgi:hypothetical protein
MNRCSVERVLLLKCSSGRRGPGPTVRPADGSGQRTVRRHDGACLRRAMFRTRNASPESATPPPRCLPAWSDVHGRGPRFPERRDQTRGIEHRSTRTQWIPGRAVAGSFTKGRRSGCEHGSTLASSVVAPGVCGRRGGTRDLTTGEDVAAASRASDCSSAFSIRTEHGRMLPDAPSCRSAAVGSTISSSYQAVGGGQ